MPNKFADRVKETSTTTGTGNITLAGAVAQFETFTANYVVGEIIPYAIVGQTGTEWEVGRGTLSGATTLVRTIVDASSNTDALVNFSAGTKDVFVSATAYLTSRTRSQGRSDAAIAGWNLP